MEEKAEKTPELLSVEKEVKGIVNINFGNEELSPKVKKVVDLIKKVHKPKQEKVKEEIKPIAEPIEEKKYSQEIKEEIFKELQIEEKKYTQELEEEPQEIEHFLPIQKPTPLKKIDCGSQERQIQERKLPKIEKTAEVLEKQALEMDLILLQPYENFIKICPLCNNKVKKKLVKRDGDILRQLMKCKNKKCTFEKEIVIQI